MLPGIARFYCEQVAIPSDKQRIEGTPTSTSAAGAPTKHTDIENAGGSEPGTRLRLSYHVSCLATTERRYAGQNPTRQATQRAWVKSEARASGSITT